MRVPLVGIKAGSTIVEPTAQWEVEGSPNTNFNATEVNSYSTPDITFNIRNAAKSPLSYPAPVFTGANATDFTATSAVCTNVEANGTCPVTVRFKPGSAGSKTATLQIGATPLNFTGLGNAGAVDPYYANVALLAHMDGANGGTSFVSQKGPTLAAGGVSSTPTTSTTLPKFGTASARFNSGTWLSSAMTSGLNLGAHSTWTVEYFFKPDGVGSSVMMAGYLDGTNRWTFEQINSTTLQVLYDNSTVTQFTTSSMAAGNWYHVAVVRVNGAVHLYLNGAEATPRSAVSYNLSNIAAGTFYLGKLGTNSYYYAGYLDEVRVTPDVARYQGSFIVPTSAFPNQ